MTANVGEKIFFNGDSVPSIHTNIQNFTAGADNLAKEILAATQPSEKYDGPVVIRHYHHYHDPFWSWYTPCWHWHSPSVVVVPSDNRDRRKKDDGAAVLVGIAATIVGGIALYALGSSISKYQDASHELEETQAFQKKLERYRPSNQNEEALLNAAADTAEIKGRICSRLKSSSSADIALRVGLVAGCSVALAGAFASAPALMTTGMVSSLVIGGGMLFKWGFDSTDKNNFRDAHSLQRSAQVLKHAYRMA